MGYSRGHKWKSGQVTNPHGRPSRGTSLVERFRSRVDPDELFDIAMSIARGEPMVQVLDQATGMPRLAAAPQRRQDDEDYQAAHKPGFERPKPVSMLQPGEVVAGIVHPTFNERIRALEFITDRAGMKPPTSFVSTSLTAQVSVGDLTRLSPEQLDQYVALCDAALIEDEDEDALLPAGDPEVP